MRIVPLGGVGEIGRNCTVIEFGDTAIALDCGVTFPDADMLGVDLVIPDFSYLRQIRHKLRAFVLTHGHEDHIGALPYALREFTAPIYGTKLTLALVQLKLEEAGLASAAQLKEVSARDRIRLGPIECEWFHVCHSIPDATGIAMHTPVGTLVHTGDFKLDHTPVDGIPPDFQTLGRLGGDGVLLLMADSTYADRAGYTPSERVIADTLDKIFADAPGRIILATFASLIARIQQALDVAATYDRRVALVGRSMERTVNVALELGYLHLPRRDMLIEKERLSDVAPERLTILSTGSQGEPQSALVRMANRDHPLIDILPDDTIVVSATAIPGNEFRVNQTIDRLFRQGASVVYERLMPIHVSGHASQEELKFILTTLRPKFFMPVHGEFRHLVQHKRLAEMVGVDGDHVAVVENGAVVEVAPSEFRVAGHVESGYVFVDGLGVGDVGEAVLRDRRHLSEDGVVVVVVTVDRHTGKPLADPDIITRGFVHTPASKELLASARAQVIAALAEGLHPEPAPNYLQNKIRNTLGRHLFQEIRRRPVILPVVTEV
ncbi:MAG: ribonuclease J [Actinobacteria bacterium]|nr:ribonuclease J [Actinomycetota bacterium]